MGMMFFFTFLIYDRCHSATCEPSLKRSTCLDPKEIKINKSNMSGISSFLCQAKPFFFKFDLNLRVELASLQGHVLMNTLFTTATEKVSREAAMGQRGENKDECKKKKGRACSWAMRRTRGHKGQSYRKSALYGCRCRGELSYTDVNWKWRYHTKQQLCVDNEKLRGQDKQWKTGVNLELEWGLRKLFEKERGSSTAFSTERVC